MARLREHGFERLPAGQHPHYTVRLQQAGEVESRRLLDTSVLGAAGRW
jgi:hypothetical protein